MRSKLNLPSSTDRRIADKLAIPGMPLSSMPLSSIPLSNMPMEWLDAGSWRLPSGKALAEFALQAGFLAPLLFNVEQFGGEPRGSEVRRLVDQTAEPAGARHFGKGSGH
jgi:hypothetical protein